MKFIVLALALFVVSQGTARAAERSVVLKVAGMTCAACPYIVKKSLTRIDGVSKVSVYFEQGRAKVVFDDARTGPAELAAAVTDSGFPSQPLAGE